MLFRFFIFLTVIFLSSVSLPGAARAQGICESFDDALTNWAPCQGAANVALTNPARPTGGGGFLQVRDLSGPSLACSQSSSPLHGDLFQGRDCASFCYDLRLIDEGNPKSSSGYSPAISFHGANGNRVVLRPSVLITEDGRSNPGWHRVCASIRKLQQGEGLPHTDDTNWSQVLDSSNAPVVDQATAFNDLMSNVVQVKLYGDFTASPSEIVAYDNMCSGDAPCPDSYSATITVDPLPAYCDAGDSIQISGQFTIPAQMNGTNPTVIIELYQGTTIAATHTAVVTGNSFSAQVPKTLFPAAGCARVVAHLVYDTGLGPIRPVDHAFSDFSNAAFDVCTDTPCEPPEPPKVVKTCAWPTEGEDAISGPNCEIKVTATADPNAQGRRFIFLQEELLAPDGTVSADMIVGLSAAGWDCLPANGPFAPAQVPQCYIADTDIPASGEMTINVSLYRPELPGTWKNCARISEITLSASASATPKMIHAAFGTDDVAPFPTPLDESCATIEGPEETDDDPEPQLCTPFTPEVACDTATGQWSVRLNNALSSSFNPTDVTVSSLTPGVSLQSTPGNPLNFNIIGAQPGDVVTVSTDAVEEGAGDGEGLDLCCMGEIDIVIPVGETCEPPPPDRVLEVTKTCIAGDQFEGYTSECTFDVHYEGPAPTPGNPIVVTDVMQSAPWSYEGLTGWAHDGWKCSPSPSHPGPQPVSCVIDAAAEPGQTWSSWDSSFTLAYNTPDAFTNCGDAQILDAAGNPVTDQSCFQIGDFDLVIVKTLSEEEGGVCVAGDTCDFTYEIKNLGSDPYSGPVTLQDSTLVGGVPQGFITAISPALCSDPTDLTSAAGCTGPITVPAGGSVFYTVSYNAPVGVDDGTEAQNCVAMTDQTMSPMDNPQDIEGQYSCADFEIGTPQIRVEKRFTAEECSVGGACNFELVIHNDSVTADYTGPVAIRDQDTPGGLQILSMVPPVCTPVPTATPFDCTANVSVPAGGSQVITVNAYMPIGGVSPDFSEAMQNCATAAPVAQGDIGNWPADLFNSSQENCAEVFMCGFACHMTDDDAEQLSVEKVLLNPEDCVPGGICTYSITVQNTGTSAVFTPLTLSETLPTGGTIVSLRSLPWSCGPGAGGATECAHPPITLNPGDTTDFELDVSIPAGFDGNEIANCTGFLTQASFEEANAGMRAATSPQLRLLSREAGPSVEEMVAYLQSRGMPASSAERMAQARAPKPAQASVRTNGAQRQDSGQQSCAIKVLSEEERVEDDDRDDNVPPPTPSNPVFALDKVCDAPVQSYFAASDGWRSLCTLTVTLVSGQSSGLADVTDTFNPQIGAGSIIDIRPPSSDWNCQILASGTLGPCLIDTALLPTGSSHRIEVEVFMPDPTGQGGLQAENCVTMPNTDKSCAVITVPSVQRGTVGLEKTCQRQAGMGANDMVQCLITVTPQGALPAGPLTITDLWTQSEIPGGAVLQVAGPEGWTCTDMSANPGAPAACVTDGASFASAGNPVQLSMIASVPRPLFGQPGFANCASADVSGAAAAENACHVFTPVEEKDDDVPPPPAGPVLEVSKQLEGACDVNKAAQSYDCRFTLGVSNVGGAAYNGPVVLNDSFGSPAPQSAKASSGDGWECLRSDGKGISCLNGSLTLEPGAQSSLSMSVTLPGLPKGGQFENCAAIGIGESEFQRALVIQSVMQRFGIDGGPVDGAPGPKTRAGVRALQERLGLDPTGQIDSALFQALGVPGADQAAPACVTADLPPMPVTCEPGQRLNSNGVCYWPEVKCAAGQLKNSKGQCYTPREECDAGQKRNSKGECYTPRPDCKKGQKRNSKGKCYWPGPKCDARTTVKRGDACVCRYKGMSQISSTRCACRSGLPPVKGVGCVKIEKKRGGDGAAGTSDSKKCLVVGGVRICR